MSRIPTAPMGQLLPRGVYKAPWMGPNGEIVLLAVTSGASLVTGDPIVLPWGSDLPAAADGLWELLDEFDPVTADIRRDVLRIS